MPKWKKVRRTVARSAKVVVRDVAAEGRSLRNMLRDLAAKQSRRRQLSTSSGAPSNCLFWDCSRTINPKYEYCYDHYRDFRDGRIDKCPRCGRGKYVRYAACWDCSSGAGEPSAKTGAAKTDTKSHRYRQEHSRAWERGDAAATQFFAYILKLDGGEFYAGQTRELRERLSEHRDDKEPSTAGRHPELAWFETISTREEATKMEVKLKKLIDSNPREIRRMIIGFRDLVGEINDG